MVTADDVRLIDPKVGDDFAAVLSWADEVRRLGVRANADTAADAARARELGAEGIGLCRTEHMFFGADREELVRDMFIAGELWRRSREEGEAGSGGEDAGDAEAEFRRTLDGLLEMQRADFVGIFGAMSGLPVTIRLLDPPIHEFISIADFERDLEEAEGAENSAAVERARLRLAVARELEETNPMLGTRGARLGLLLPPLYEMQVAAILEAALAVTAAGDPPKVEIMIPLIAFEGELEALRDLIHLRAERVMHDAGAEIEYSVGTMIELPRACLRAGDIAANADFFSFGTNDLTQTTIGLSRDDAEGSFLPSYLSNADPHAQSLRDDRRARRRRAGQDRGRAGPGHQARPTAGDMRRARRRPREHRVLRLGRTRLCELLAVPRSHRQGRRRSGSRPQSDAGIVKTDR